MPFDSDKENRAIEGLISGALHPFSGDFSDEDIAKFLTSDCQVSSEGKIALSRLGNPLTESKIDDTSPHLADVEGEYAAMHRDLAEKEIDEETKAELARKREEILRKLRNNRNKNG